MYDWKKIIVYCICGIFIITTIIFCGTTIKWHVRYTERNKQYIDCNRQLGNSLQTIERYRVAESKVRESSERIGTRLGDMSDCLSKQRGSITELRSLLKEMEDYYNNMWSEYQRLDSILNSNDCSVNKEVEE